MLGGHDDDYVRIVWVVAAAFGLLATLALAILYRRASRQRDLEEAERILAEDDAPLP